MKVIILHTTANSPGILGGNYRHIYNWATLLIRKNIEVTVCLAGPHINVVKSLATQYRQAGVKTIVLNEFSSFYKAFLWKGRKEIQSIFLREKPDIIHTLNIQSDIISAYNKKNGKYKCVSSLEGALFPLNKSIKSKLYKLLNQYFRKQIDLTLSISEYTLNQHVERGDIQKEKSRVLYSGIDLSLFPPKNNPSNECRVIGFLGRMTEGKCPDLFIKVADRLNKAGFNQKYIMGGDGHMLETCKSMVRSFNLESQFEFVGAVANVSAFLEKIDLLLFLSEREGLPWVVLETMASNVPIIASSVGGVPEVIKNNINGILLNDNSIETVFNATRDAIINYDEHMKMANVARPFIEENFNCEVEIKNLIGFYNLVKSY